MKNKLKKIGETFEIPVGIISGYYLEIFSGSEAVLNGDAAVINLGDTVLELKCGEHRIGFFGSGLKIEYYTCNGIKITGSFSEIKFL